MVEKKQCDGVVIGRGCLGRPWLFRDLIDAFSGKTISATPTLGEVLPVMVEHAEALMDHLQDERGIRDFRKHTGWYLTGYPVGGEVRRKFSEISSLDDLRRLADSLDPSIVIVEGGEATRGGKADSARATRDDGNFALEPLREVNGGNGHGRALLSCERRKRFWSR